MSYEDSPLLTKSKAFALRVVDLYKYLSAEKKEYTLSKQILRSGTSIGANLREARRGQSRLDFNAKIYISLKEAEETLFWLELLFESGFIDRLLFDSLRQDCDEILRMLVSTSKTVRNNINDKR